MNKLILAAVALALLPLVAQAEIVSQVHNAPGWAPGSYAAKARVNAGPGWTGGAYMPGQSLAAYEAATACVEGATFGSGCTWNLLSTTDYISLTGWAYDNKEWANGAYVPGDYATVGSPLRTYMLINANCTSTVAPSGTSATLTASDGCQWRYYADVIYTSKRSYIPTQSYVATGQPNAQRVTDHYKAELWNDREYLAGQNGENAVISIRGHYDYNQLYASEANFVTPCTTNCYRRIITAAPGESFRDNLTESPLRCDPAKGVALRSATTTGFTSYDNFIDIIGLQIKSDVSAAFDALSSYGNHITIRDSCLEGGGTAGANKRYAVGLDAGRSVLANSLVISHGTIGVASKYPAVVLHSTIVKPNPTPNSVGVARGVKWDFEDTTVSNTGIFGFTHAGAGYSSPVLWSPLSANNMTDAPVGDSGSIIRGWENYYDTTVTVIPGTTYGVSPSSVFVNPANDWRLSSGSPLRGAGSAFGSFSVGCFNATPTACPVLMTHVLDTPDILRTVRPQNGAWDIGAFQTASGGAPPPPPPPPVVVNGVCGGSNGVAVSSAPTTGFCSAGSASAVNGSGPWSWWCGGTNGGTTSACLAPLLAAPPPPPPVVNGACGAANGSTPTNVPTSGLCATGTASPVTGTGPWFWNCAGSGGGSTSTCGAAPPASPPPINYCPSGCTAR